MEPIRNIFRWLKLKRTNFSFVGYVIHMGALVTCLGLSIYWWRAWKHMLDTGEAALTAYKWSQWHGFYWLEGLLEIPIHIFSEPIYCLQIFAISLVFALFTNKDGYYYSANAAVAPRRSSGFGVLALFFFLRR